MSWYRMSCDQPGGTKLYLQKLAASPLVRKTLLPNAATVCSQHFAFQHLPASSWKNISSFLVHEPFVHKPLSAFMRVVVKIMAPFWVPITIRHLLFRDPRWDEGHWGEDERPETENGAEDGAGWAGTTAPSHVEEPPTAGPRATTGSFFFSSLRLLSYHRNGNLH